MGYVPIHSGKGSTLTPNIEYQFSQGSNSAITNISKTFTIQHSGSLILTVSLSGAMYTKTASVTINGNPIAEATNVGDTLSALREFTANVEENDEVIVTVNVGAPYSSSGRSAYQIIATVV